MNCHTFSKAGPVDAQGRYQSSFCGSGRFELYQLEDDIVVELKVDVHDIDAPLINARPFVFSQEKYINKI